MIGQTSSLHYTAAVLHTPMDISVVIPCLNEELTIGECVQMALQGISQSGLSGEVIVSDNGSVDKSVEISKAMGARVTHCKIPGYGAAIDHGISQSQAKIVVFADADLSYDFREIPKIIQPILKGDADLVLGNRINQKMQLGSMPWINQKIGTPFLSFLIRKLYGIKTSDCNSGMRAILRDRYSGLNLQSPGMEFASEMLLKAARQFLKYREVDIQFRKDQRNRPPHLRRWRDGSRHLWIILSSKF